MKSVLGWLLMTVSILWATESVTAAQNFYPLLTGKTTSVAFARSLQFNNSNWIESMPLFAVNCGNEACWFEKEARANASCESNLTPDISAQVAAQKLEESKISLSEIWVLLDIPKPALPNLECVLLAESNEPFTPAYQIIGDTEEPMNCCLEADCMTSIQLASAY